eukprot:Awhi_evm1s6279
MSHLGLYSAKNKEEEVRNGQAEMALYKGKKEAMKHVYALLEETDGDVEKATML